MRHRALQHALRATRGLVAVDTVLLLALKIPSSQWLAVADVKQLAELGGMAVEMAEK